MAYAVVKWKEHQDASERILRWMVTNNGEKPVYVTINGQRFTTLEYEDALKRVQKWIDTNKENPLTVDYGTPDAQRQPSKPAWDGVYREQPYGLSHQPDNYSCGSNTAANILRTFGIRTTDAEMRRYCGTGGHGTNPEDLIRGVIRKMKESGFPNSGCNTYNTSDLGSDIKAIEKIGEYMAGPLYSVAVLVNTGGSGWKKYYRGTFEHWVMPVEVNTKNKTMKINDPARSNLLSFTYNEFMSGVKLVPRKSWYVFVAKK